MIIANPIEIGLGVLYGRDCIYLERVEQDYSNKLIRLIGEINGGICSNGVKDDFIQYTLEFNNVYLFKMVELDLSFELMNVSFNKSSFLEINDSEIIRQAKKTRGVDLRHFILQTYDDVFEILCRDYKLEFDM